jgi:drug/metabolite transporter (DMT)-like permease
VTELVVVSVIWSFSSGLIKHHLVSLDSNVVAFARMGLALLALLPFLRPSRVSFALALHLTAIGALQIGLIYVAYIRSYQYLASFEVALLTIFTPVWCIYSIDVPHAASRS